MRTKVLLSRSAFGFAFAATCATGLQLSGCARSSRDVGNNLAEQARESALRTEKAIAQRRERSEHAELAKQRELEKVQEKGKVLLSGNDSNASESPLAKYLSEANAGMTTDDPFLERNTLVNHETTSEVPEEKPAQSEWDSLLKKHLHREQSSSNWAKESSLSKELSSSQEASQSVKPFPPETLSETFRPRSEAKDAWITEPQPERKVVQAQPTTQAPSWAAGWEDRTPKVVDKSPTSASAIEPIPQQERLRMETLISQAQSQAIRGDLHAAYRSALLAKKIADDYSLAFEEGSPSPDLIAKEISQQIWGPAKESPQPAVTPDRYSPEDLPRIEPRRRRSVAHDAVFNTPEDLSQWKPVGATLGGDAIAAAKAAGQGDWVNLSATRVATDTERLSQKKRLDQAPAVPSDANGQSERVATTDDSNGQQSAHSITIEPRNAVQFAIAHTTTPESETERASQVSGMPDVSTIPDQPVVKAPLAAPFPPVDSVATVESPQPVKQRPALMAPERSGPVQTADVTPAVKPVVDLHESFDFELERSEETVAATQKASETVAQAPSSTGRFKWAVVAFIGAVFSTLIGLRLSGGSRRKDDDDHDKPASNAQSVEQPRELKIKRAA